MSSPPFLRALIDLATCESVEALLDDAITLIDRHLGMRCYVEVWDDSGQRFSAGALFLINAAHCTWIGTRYTIGSIRLQVSPSDPSDIELLACQIAPIVELLLEREARRRTIRDEIERIYERRIHEALIRCDWNVTAVARELNVGRTRVIEVMRRLRARSSIVSDQDS